MQTICISLQTEKNTNTRSLKFYRPDALSDAFQVTEDTLAHIVISVKKLNSLKYGIRSQVTCIKRQKTIFSLGAWCIIMNVVHSTIKSS